MTKGVTQLTISDGFSFWGEGGGCVFTIFLFFITTTMRKEQANTRVGVTVKRGEHAGVSWNHRNLPDRSSCSEHKPSHFLCSLLPSPLSTPTMATLLSTNPVLYIPPSSSLTDPSLPRPRSPMPRPPSRSERMLRETLERDNSSRLHLQIHGPSSYHPPSSILSSMSDDYAIESDEDLPADDSWLENPVRRSRSSSRPKSPSILRPIQPKFHRTQTSPPTSPTHNGHARTRSNTSIPTASRAVNIPRSQTPAPSNSANRYFTPPSSSNSLFYSFRPSSITNGDSVARARLERALHRDRSKWDQHVPDRHSGGPYRVTRRGSVSRHNSKESNEVSLSFPISSSPTRKSYHRNTNRLPTLIPSHRRHHRRLTPKLLHGYARTLKESFISRILRV